MGFSAVLPEASVEGAANCQLLVAPLHQKLNF